MKKPLLSFISNCRNLFFDSESKAAFSANESFQKSYLSSLKYVEKYGSAIAYEQASDWEEHKSDLRWDKVLQTLEKQGIESKSSVRPEMDRMRRAEELIEMGKSYRPTFVENSRQQGREMGDD